MTKSNDRIKLETSWKSVLEDEFSKDYMINLRKFLIQEKKSNKCIYPPSHEIFNGFNLTPFNKVEVVILGQDPYHGPNQAHGLCFSVKPEIAPPPSLINIYKELQSDLGIQPPDHGCLIPWAQQGVLLLNSVLTVEQSKAGSHQNKGWEQFTDKVIEVLNIQSEHIVFLLWGSYAQDKGKFIDTEKHLVLKAPHPSPLSANRGFFGCRHFSAANYYLKKVGKTPIDWVLPSKNELTNNSSIQNILNHAIATES